MNHRSLLALVALAAFAGPALAHPGHGSAVGGVSAGFVHPFLGLDHVLAMLAVGIWARLLGGKALWGVPAAFVVCMVAGFFVARSGLAVPAAELGVATSVFVLGLLVAFWRPLSLALPVALVALFAFFHGYAHGIDVAHQAASFGVGFAAATALLHAIGVAMGRFLLAKRRVALARASGLGMAAVGAVLMGGWL